MAVNYIAYCVEFAELQLIAGREIVCPLFLIFLIFLAMVGSPSVAIQSFHPILLQ